MLEKIEKMIGNNMIRSILSGVSLAVSLLFVVVCLAFVLLAIVNSVWWLIASAICAVCAGAAGGLYGYL